MPEEFFTPAFLVYTSTARLSSKVSLSSLKKRYKDVKDELMFRKKERYSQNKLRKLGKLSYIFLLT